MNNNFTQLASCLRLTNNVKLAQSRGHQSRPHEVIGSITIRNNFFNFFSIRGFHRLDEIANNANIGSREFTT